jgi:outer membrane lipase/esterase
MQLSNVKYLALNPNGYGLIFLTCGSLLFALPANAGQNQVAVDNAIKDACFSGAVGGRLQLHCNAYNSAFPIAANPEDSDTQRGQLRTKILWATTSTQSSTPNTQSSEMNNNQIATINNRMAGLRNGIQGGGVQVSGTVLDSNGNPVAIGQSTQSNNTPSIGDLDRLGVYINGKIGFGDRRLTENELGYNQDTHGVTAGVDYRFTDHFLLGTSFSFDHASARYFHDVPGSFGDMKTDSYSGALYGSFFTDNGFFVDGLFSGSNANYTTNRKIQYAIPGDSIDTIAKSKNQGTEYNLAVTGGYNYYKGGFTITPQVRVDYKNNQVDALDEQGGDGFGLHTDGQSFESLQTAAGLQLSYAWSTPWGVISPMVRAEYIHEFENDSRIIQSYFLEDQRQKRFNILTDRPDRDYIVASAGVSAQFAHGISAFVNYDTIQAHSYINNHSFSGGIRAELPF